MAGAGKDKIQVIAHKEPKFIREFKERANLPEDYDIDSKRLAFIDKHNDGDEDDDSESLRPDEAPVVTVEKDVSREEAYAFTKKMYGENVVPDSDSELKVKRKHDSECPGEESEKVIFKKPTKEEKTKSKQKKKSKSNMPKVKNMALLSFDDDDET